MIITIDGYSCQGKSYYGKKLADAMQMEFLSTGKMVRYTAYLFSELYNHQLDAHCTWIQALDEMYKVDMQEIVSCSYLETERTEKALQLAAADPIVNNQVEKRIISYAKDKNIVLDGRFTFRIFPNAYRNYYFCSTLQRRVNLYARSSGIPIDQALEYIKFRDSFEENYIIPSYVKIIQLDDFPDEDSILRYLKKDILVEG